MRRMSKFGGAGGPGGARGGTSGAAGAGQPQLAARLHAAAALASWRSSPSVVGAAARPLARQGPSLPDAGPCVAPHPRGCRGRGAFRRTQAAVVRRVRKRDLIDRAPVAAVDGSRHASNGLETRRVSACFGARRANGKGHRQRAWPKLTAVVHAHSHLILDAVPGVGPSQDSPDFAPAMRQTAGLVAIDAAPADTGGLRRRAQPPPMLRRTRHPPNRDPPQPPQHGTALAQNPVPPRDAASVPKADLQPALARRERLQPTQAPPRVSPDRARRRGSRTRTRSPRPHP